MKTSADRRLAIATAKVWRKALQTQKESDTKEPDQPPPYQNVTNDLVERLDQAQKFIAAILGIGAVFYGFGFVIVNSFYGEFGVRSFSLSLPTYLVSGLSFLLPSLPALLTLSLLWASIGLKLFPYEKIINAAKTKDLSSLKDNKVFQRNIYISHETLRFRYIRGEKWARIILYIIAGFLLISIAISIFLIPQTGIQVSEILQEIINSISSTSHYHPFLIFLYVMVYVVFLIAGIVLLHHRREFIRALRACLCDRVHNCVERKMNVPSEFLFLLHDKNNSNTQSENYTMMSLMAFLVAALFVPLALLWAKNIYPRIPHALGGGNDMGARVQVIFDYQNLEAARLMTTLNSSYGVYFHKGISEPLRVLAEDELEIIAILLKIRNSDGPHALEEQLKDCMSLVDLTRMAKEGILELHTVKIPKDIVISEIYSVCR
ncbi:hypothetical protein [Mangrovicoccus sp. HB161399]|uniref:hypothetical protein n=1 Tax=Mangrovicoccus sp. HB161399 TaxID=2720392 RepID=UPI0015550F7F|nr:hypothetical protein [Mangrovicoccus sp. HB161399]